VASRRIFRLVSALPLLGAMAACGGEPRFPLREPMVRDDDETPFAEEPDEYVSPFAWDGANQIVFRPIARFFAVDPAGRATNVNAFDEVPNSSWFENRISMKPVSAAEMQMGPCGEKVLDPNAPDGAWTIDKGKSNGANPGFRVNIKGIGKFMLKVDPPGEPERATGATAIAARLYHAAGYYAPCDSVVYFKPSVLKLTPGLSVTDNSGVSKPFDEKALKKVLDGASKRNDLLRMGASRWLPGKPIGPYRYEGTRKDDPNDVIDHEDRRELRGARVLAAWLNHFDSREQNTMDVFVPQNPGDEKAKGGPGYVRHYILDLGDCFGSVWNWDEISRRLGHAYYFDVPYLTEDFVTFGTIERPWERARREGGIFNYFSERDFDPDLWRGGYPNPAFQRMTEADGAWMARIIGRMNDDLVKAAVAMGQYDEQATAYLTRVLLIRRDVILKRYLTKISPLSDVRIEGDQLCATDLARASHVASGAPSYRIEYRRWEDDARATLPASAASDTDVCTTLPHRTPVGRPDDAANYMVVSLRTASARYPLHVHLYDLGSKGFQVVGLERPESASAAP
jgi:hypothetical protein